MNLWFKCKAAGLVGAAALLGLSLSGKVGQAAESAPSLGAVTQAEITRATLKKEERQHQASQYVVQGEDFMKARRFREALEQYSLACSLDPENKEAQAGRNEARRYLEARPESGSGAAQVINQEKVRQEYNLAEISQYIALAEKRLSEAASAMEGVPDTAKVQLISLKFKQLSEAENAAIRANLRLDSLGAADKVKGYDELKDRVRKLLSDSRQMKTALQSQLEQLSQGVALAQTEKDKKVIAEIEENRRQAMLQQAKTAEMQLQFNEAVKVYQELLRLNPADTEVKAMMDKCALKEMDVRDKVVNDISREHRLLNMENIEKATITEVTPRNPLKFPKNWQVMVKQKSLGKGNEVISAAMEKTRRKLENSYTFEFPETEFSMILDVLRNGTGLNIVVDKAVSESPVMSEQYSFSFRNMRMDNILKWVMRRTGLRYNINDSGIINIISKDSVGEIPTVEVYDIRDIAYAITDAKKMPEDDDDDDDDDEEERGSEDTVKLDDILNNFINKGEGGEETKIEIAEGTGLLTVKATAEVKQQIEKLLAQLRSAQTIQVSVSARFLTLQDNFWEQFRSEFMDWNNYSSSADTTKRAMTVGGSSAYGGNTSDNLSIYNRNNPTANATMGIQADQYLNPTSVNGGFNPATYYSGVMGSVYNGTFTGLSTVFGDSRNMSEINNSGLVGQIQEMGFLGDIQAQWFLQMIRESSRSDELFSPQLVVYNNRYGWIKFVDRYPYISSYVAGDGDSGLQPVITYIDEGCTLQVRPNVSSDKKYITVDARPRVIRVDNKRVDTITLAGQRRVTSTAGTSITPFSYTIELPQTFKHDSKTYAIIPDGGAIMITGLSTNVNGRGDNGIPVLKDVPGIGNAFSSRFYQKDKRSYACLLNARIIILDEEEASQVGGR